MKSQFSQQYIVNTIAKLLSGNLNIYTMSIANDLGDLFQHCEPSDHVNEIRGFSFESDISGSRFTDVDEANDSADDHVSAYVSHACSQATDLLRAKHKILISGKSSDSILELHDLDSKMNKIVEEYGAIGLKPIAFKMSAPIESMDTYESFKSGIQDDRALEAFVDVNIVHLESGVELEVWVPDDKKIIDRAKGYLGSFGDQIGAVSFTSVAPSIPGYKSVNDYLIRLERKRELEAEFGSAPEM